MQRYLLAYLNFDTDVEPTTICINLPKYQYFGILHINTQTHPKIHLFWEKGTECASNTINNIPLPVADLGGFQGFHGTPLLASVVIESYGSLAFSKTQLYRI